MPAWSADAPAGYLLTTNLLVQTGAVETFINETG
jgi:hypothetical protein